MSDERAIKRTLSLHLSMRTLSFIIGTLRFIATKTQDPMATVFLVSLKFLKIALETSMSSKIGEF